MWGQEGEPRELIVRDLSFDGNRAIDDNVLRISIATSQSAFFARARWLRWMGLGEKRYLNETELRRDVVRIQALYRLSGFVDATVDTLVRRSGGDVFIRFLIYEGEPVRVTSLGISGVGEILPQRELERALPLQAGEPFNRLLLRAAADTIRVRLSDRGYPFAQVFRNFDEDRENRTAVVSFEVDPGPRATVERVEVSGTQRIDEGVVRRAIALRPGQIFRQRDLYESQLDLYRMGVFNYVNVALADTLLGDPDDSLVTVNVQVTEGPLHRVRLGVGYGTIDCFRTLTSYSVHDFLGGGRTLEFNARLSKIGAGDPLGAGFESSVCRVLSDEDSSRLKLNYNLNASLQEPFFFSRNTSAAVTLFAERHSEFQAFLRQVVGGGISLTQQTPWDVPVTLSYDFTYGSTKADAATFCSFLNVCRVEDTRAFTEDLIRSTVSLAAVRDRRSSVLDPMRGSRLALELRHASTLIGSDSLAQFNKGTLEFASHHPVSWHSVFSWRLKVGAIISPELGLSGQDLQFVPPEERFYAGGPNTVRGFGQNELGPLVRVLESGDRDTVTVADETGADTTLIGNRLRTSPTGGNDLLVLNTELRFPVPGFAGRLVGAVFVDAGQVRSRGEEILDLGGLRITPGAGIRLSSPLGPVRLDVAFNPYDVEESPLYVEEVIDGSTELRLLPGMYRPKRGFLGRFRIHFSVGQAF